MADDSFHCRLISLSAKSVLTANTWQFQILFTVWASPSIDEHQLYCHCHHALKLLLFQKAVTAFHFISFIVFLHILWAIKECETGTLLCSMYVLLKWFKIVYQRLSPQPRAGYFVMENSLLVDSQKQTCDDHLAYESPFSCGLLRPQNLFAWRSPWTRTSWPAEADNQPLVKEACSLDGLKKRHVTENFILARNLYDINSSLSVCR